MSDDERIRVGMMHCSTEPMVSKVLFRPIKREGLGHLVSFSPITELDDLDRIDPRDFDFLWFHASDIAMHMPDRFEDIGRLLDRVVASGVPYVAGNAAGDSLPGLHLFRERGLDLWPIPFRQGAFLQHFAETVLTPRGLALTGRWGERLRGETA